MVWLLFLLQIVADQSYQELIQSKCKLTDWNEIAIITRFHGSDTLYFVHRNLNGSGRLDGQEQKQAYTGG